MVELLQNHLTDTLFRLPVNPSFFWGSSSEVEQVVFQITPVCRRCFTDWHAEVNTNLLQQFGCPGRGFESHLLHKKRRSTMAYFRKLVTPGSSPGKPLHYRQKRKVKANLLQGESPNNYDLSQFAHYLQISRSSVPYFKISSKNQRHTIT